MNDAVRPDWYPRDESVLADQRQAYDTMREKCPVAHSEFLNWSLFRHADIVAVLSDPQTYSSATKRHHIPNGMDEPEHTLYRRELEPYFTQELMAGFEPQFRQVASALVDALINQDQPDFVTEFAEPFSFRTHCAFLGWDAAVWEQLVGWMHGNQQSAFTQDRSSGRSLALTYSDLVTAEVERRRNADESQSDDITSRLMVTEVNGEPLSDENIVSILRNWTAGHGTVAAAIGILALHLAQDQDLQAKLRANPALLGTAIDEILRVDGPLVANRRTTTREVELGGRTIGAGEPLTLMWIAANRDERVFEDPTTVKLDRSGEDNLVFGQGIHDCVGAPLARLLMRVAVEELLARTERFELAEQEQPARSVYPSNGMASMKMHLE